MCTEYTKEDNMTSEIERFEGAMVGNLAGDALGAPYETMRTAAIAEDIERRGGKLTFFNYPDPFLKQKDGWPAGRPTDDSEMTAALAKSILDKGGFDAEHTYGYFHRLVVKEESILWNGPSSGFGGTTRTMTEFPSYHESRAIHEPPRVASNGSLMRTVPVGLFWFRKPGRQAHIARLASEVTHLNPIAGEACIIYCAVLRHLLRGVPPREAIKIAFRECVEYTVFTPDICSLQDRVFEQPVQPVYVQGEKKPWHILGSAAYSLHVALSLLPTSGTFEEGITNAILRGGDTDTYAAILGGLLGAHFGIKGIPGMWQKKLLGTSRMIEFADLLYATSPH